MYEFRHSDNKVSWRIPPEYARYRWRQEMGRLLARLRAVAKRLILVVVVLEAAIGAVAVLAVPTAWKAIVTALLVTPPLALVWLGAASAGGLWQPRGCLHVENGFHTGYTFIHWDKVGWWNVADTAEFPGLRVLAVGITSGRGFVWRIGFDPTEVKEDILLAFLRRVAPDKEHKAEGQ